MLRLLSIMRRFLLPIVSDPRLETYLQGIQRSNGEFIVDLRLRL